MGLAQNVLVIGGQRSGKSRFAEELVARSGRRPVYIATATAGDDEMAARIAAHRERRGDAWMAIEAPLNLPAALGRAAAGDAAVLVDCLTLWLANLIAAERDIAAESEALVAALSAADCPVVVVTNEVGAGVIPDNALARRYADALGTLNQLVAEAVGRVVLIAAGRPLLVKPSPTPEISL
jgi:adenosylcobinamide kinase/adenosylcobinamide-phosphate guanylyltransferase